MCIRDRTEPGLLVTIRNPSVGAVQEVTADERGVFSAEVNLGPDSNRIEASARDAAGNTGRQSVTVTRGDGVPQAKPKHVSTKRKTGLLDKKMACSAR